ncbi:VOC family protein [bacterium]|nr:VOC family protein [bacterium]
MISGINHITLAVRNIEESFKFYQDVLGLKPIQKSASSAYFLAGDTWIALTKDRTARSAPLPEYTHIAFSVSLTNFMEMKERINQSGAKEWQKNKSEGESHYFIDPDGHKLEIHASDLEARISSGKKEWGDSVHWYV